VSTPAHDPRIGEDAAMLRKPRSRLWLIVVPIAAILIVLLVLAATRGFYEVTAKGEGLLSFSDD